MATEPDKALLRAALPNYDIGAELGRGGWGVVYAASHAKLGRRVAVKSLPRALAADPAVRGRFLEEAQFAARLSHPHVVQVHDYVDTHGVLAIVMERMEPRTLWDRFVQDGIVAHTAVAVAVAVSSALHAAHLLGRAHLDVKPENVLFDAAHVPKLSDFGVARIIGMGREQTPLAEVIGTPAYMSPEQARGIQVGPASDVYSTAVMTYELLAGRLPFPSTDAPQEMLAHHVNDAPAPLVGVPAPLAAAVMRGLAKDPAARYASAEDFALAIGRAATEVYGSRWLRDSGLELRLPGRLLDGIQSGAPPEAIAQQPTKAAPGPATQPHTRLGTVLEPSRPPTAAALQPPEPGSGLVPETSTAGPLQPLPGQPPGGLPSTAVTPPSDQNPPADPPPTAVPPPTGPGVPPTGPGVPPVPGPGVPPGAASAVPPAAGGPFPAPPAAPSAAGPPPPAWSGSPTGPPPSGPGDPADTRPRQGLPPDPPRLSELADLSHQAGPYLATAATSNAFHAAKSKSKAPKVLMGIAAALILVGGIFVAVRVFTGGDDTAAPSTTVATTSTTAGPVLDREGTVVDEDLLSAFTAACLTLEIDGSKAKFCDCAREVVPGQTTKKELEAAIAAFFGIRGSIPPSVQAAMRTCTTRTTSPPGAAPPSGAPPSTTK